MIDAGVWKINQGILELFVTLASAVDTCSVVVVPSTQRGRIQSLGLRPQPPDLHSSPADLASIASSRAAITQNVTPNSWMIHEATDLIAAHATPCLPFRDDIPKT